jgi:hypothetical protein
MHALAFVIFAVDIVVTLNRELESEMFVPSDMTVF